MCVPPKYSSLINAKLLHCHKIIKCHEIWKCYKIDLNCHKYGKNAINCHKMVIWKHFKYKPVVLFLADSLQSILMMLMKIFIKSEVLDVANCSENKLVKLDVSNLANQIPIDIIRFPTATKTSSLLL